MNQLPQTKEGIAQAKVHTKKLKDELQHKLNMRGESFRRILSLCRLYEEAVFGGRYRERFAAQLKAIVAIREAAIQDWAAFRQAYTITFITLERRKIDLERLEAGQKPLTLPDLPVPSTDLGIAA